MRIATLHVLVVAALVLTFSGDAMCVAQAPSTIEGELKFQSTVCCRQPPERVILLLHGSQIPQQPSRTLGER
jgi:hypothetical protein